ncbi:hypothetical protein IM792_13250 [Mucilaginibacter sp. JRF]|uniref:hypothetical protein n=1 Tax=Mucilaginibacter sp. JRF TaxID=2780088 RepID=UPI00187E7F91|nr:hypothetical protein [Mucilaginibacter sp. JRF]MBE9585417.1 hypothetical protein [Mucilaginibacter sp. JRF]
MMHSSSVKYVFLGCAVLLMAMASCGGDGHNDKPKVYKGLYSFGPEIKSFSECGREKEFWVTDSSSQLELEYSQLNFEKPYEPVYVEVEGVKVPSDKDGLGAEYDSTLVVRKLIKITREIPQDICH